MSKGIWKELGIILIVGLIVLLWVSLGFCGESGSQGKFSGSKWKITAYCAKKCCCGKWADGRTASNKPVKYGYVANNWLSFGTKIQIEGIGSFEVQDRGARSYFGSKTNHIKAFDIYMDSHLEAKKFGVKYRRVTIL